MSDRSLKATLEGIKIAKNTLTGKAISQEKFANDLNVARSTVSNFFTGKPVDRQIFVQLCDNLGLSWEEISGDSILPISSTAEKEASEEDKVKAKQIAADHISAGRDIHLNISQVIANEFTQSAESTSLPNISIEELVQIVRARCEVDIQEQCGTMRVLDMEHPISLNEIYTDVNILEKLTRNQRKGVEELLARFRADDFSRWGLGEKQERIEGIAAVYRHSKLMILGKPGAGKTTFLKFLATACINGNLFAERVPVFVTLKDFADTENTSSLLGFIVRQFEQYGIAETTQVKRGLFDSLLNRDVNAMETLLRKGKMLVLLDGLDEVREKDDERVVREIRRFSQHYSQSQIVVTCRIAAKQYTFEQFIEVEIADFDEQQITTFSGNWFRHKQVKAKDFLAELKKYGGVEELATSPLLLTLLCLAFEESGNFPANRAELYKEGLDALLRKWDSKRGIR